MICYRPQKAILLDTVPLARSLSLALSLFCSPFECMQMTSSLPISWRRACWCARCSLRPRRATPHTYHMSAICYSAPQTGGQWPSEMACTVIKWPPLVPQSHSSHMPFCPSCPPCAPLPLLPPSANGCWGWGKRFRCSSQPSPVSHGYQGVQCTEVEWWIMHSWSTGNFRHYCILVN